MELIPGLPNDVALDCLIRVPYEYFSVAESVCRSWRVEIKLPEFWRHRKAAGLSRRVIVMAQARVNQIRKTGVLKCSANPVYRLTLCEPETGNWSEVPPVPGWCPDGLPMFCQLTGVGFNLVVIGGLNPVTWEASNTVFIYNFVSAAWRRGANMPGSPRSFFACASDSDRTVFVAGGHDNEKNALRSAIVYDVAKDEWVLLPDMAKERDECKGVFHRGKFHCVGGYHTEMQGRFEKSAEAFDAVTWQWDQVEEDFLGSATCPRTCVDGGDGRMYICRDGDVLASNNSTWEAVAQLPSEVTCAPYMTAWKGQLLVIGTPRFGEPHKAYVLDLKSDTWTKVVAPQEFSGHVQSGCCLEI